MRLFFFHLPALPSRFSSPAVDDPPCWPSGDLRRPVLTDLAVLGHTRARLRYDETSSTSTNAITHASSSRNLPPVLWRPCRPSTPIRPITMLAIFSRGAAIPLLPALSPLSFRPCRPPRHHACATSAPGQSRRARLLPHSYCPFSMLVFVSGPSLVSPRLHHTHLPPAATLSASALYFYPDTRMTLLHLLYPPPRQHRLHRLPHCISSIRLSCITSPSLLMCLVPHSWPCLSFCISSLLLPRVSFGILGLCVRYRLCFRAL
ncbi:hypothetical protein K438DRAFT_978592 [Mycena galopus ATCC 62051]|nr:hypothetical protein K438DRAFT_978592 [Mycena galopus ATCC 62051]